MSYHHRPHDLRLAISSEAEALISDFGGAAYVEACRRASEASSDSLARDGALSRRRSLAGRAGAHPCSTPYSVEQADPNPRPRALRRLVDRASEWARCDEVAACRRNIASTLPRRLASYEALPAGRLRLPSQKLQLGGHS